MRDSAAPLALSWLIRLRWVVLAGYTVLAALGLWWLDLDLPRGLLGTLLLVGFATNVVARVRWSSDGAGSRSLTGGLLVLDTLLLSGLLYASGGPLNPFSATYLVHVALAAAVLGPRWGWSMALLTSLCFGLVYRWHLPLGYMEHPMEGMEWHLGGMWLSLSLSGALIAHFVGRLASALDAQTRNLAELETRTQKNARLAALTTLAAGVAHELATPLGTIAVAAGELASMAPPDLQSDALLIRQEANRCRRILTTLRQTSGEPVGEAPEKVDWGALAASLKAEFPTLEVQGELPAILVLPADALLRALRALVTNAIEASPKNGTVRLNLGVEDHAIRLEIVDQGRGMSVELLARLGEPFFTTKGPSNGMGLGVFLARTFAEQCGGSLRFESVEGTGTSAAFHFPSPSARG
jgi:two-component system, sensor histidine kinase RegB